jgi:hypothetical protein
MAARQSARARLLDELNGLLAEKDLDRSIQSVITLSDELLSNR